jgi:hypothetical protein
MFAFEDTRARSRNKDGKIVPGTTKTFKTAAYLNVTLAHAQNCLRSSSGWQLRRLSLSCEP